MSSQNLLPGLIDRFENNTATVTELRVGIFAPIEKISANSTIYKDFIKNNRKRKLTTPWGEVTVKGNILTQIHRDIIDAIMSIGTIEKTDNNNFMISFIGAELLRYLGKSPKNHTWLKKILDELKTTNIEYTDKKGNSIDFNISSAGGYSSQKGVFVVMLTESYVKFYEQEVVVNYKQEIPQLIKVDDALVKAIIRFFFTHANKVSFNLEKLLDTLGYPVNAASLKTAKKKMRDHTQTLKDFGIIFDKSYKVTYSKREGVTHSLSKVKKTLMEEGSKTSS
jgi:hypothetical protein